MAPERHAVVVGSGPNGLAAAIEMARNGWQVTVFEGRDEAGGGMRTRELTLPGFQHDVCSSVHPLAASSPFFSSLPLERHGLEWVHPDIPLAIPLEDGNAILMHRSLDETADGLGADADAYRRLMGPMVSGWSSLSRDVLAPVFHFPRNPVLLARFGLQGIRSLHGLAMSSFSEGAARTLLAGLAAHVNLPLRDRLTASFGLVLGVAGHAVGWPVARGGSKSIAAALESYLRSLGGEIVTNHQVESLDELPESEATFLDLTPQQVVKIGGKRLPDDYAKKLRRYRYADGVFKIDFALDGPIPWKSPDCARAGTIHIGESMEEIIQSEDAVAAGRSPERPYILMTQPSLFDSTRAPEGKHTAWAYCHVPAGSTFDMTERIEAQIERFAPGFRDRILARHMMSPADLEAYNPNYIGGDIAGGSMSGLQLFLRPTLSLRPYTTPVRGLYICSAATPPGGGVHGMCGYNAARRALSIHR